MPIISAEKVNKGQIYRVSLMVYQGITENVIVDPDGLYCVYVVRDGRIEDHTGRILNVVQNNGAPDKSHILFEKYGNRSYKREQIPFHRIQMIRDVTPNDAYRKALKHGFVGSEEDWLKSLRGERGYSAYEVAVNECNFQGTAEEWLLSLVGPPGEQGEPGKSTYELAVEQGKFEGTEEEWVDSQMIDLTLISDALSATEAAQAAASVAILASTTALEAAEEASVLTDRVTELEDNVVWKESMND